MPVPLNPNDREELRFALREQLVTAASVALTADMLTSRLKRGRTLVFDPPAAEVVAALNFLVDLGFATATPSPMGSTLYYQATAAGVLAHERGH